MGDSPLNHFDVMPGAALILLMSWIVSDNPPFYFVMARNLVSPWASEIVDPSVS